jgi:nitronate monooxygenase
VWHCLSSCNFREAPYCISQALANAAQGNMDEGFAFTGSNGYRATKIQYVTEVIDELIAEYNSASINKCLIEKVSRSIA